MVVDSTAVLLPERPTQVNVRSVITDRSMIKREMARARDVGLLSVIAFDSKSNYLKEREKKIKVTHEIRGNVTKPSTIETLKGNLSGKYLHYQRSCRRAPNVYLAVVIQSRHTPIQRYYQRVDES